MLPAATILLSTALAVLAVLGGRWDELFLEVVVTPAMKFSIFELPAVLDATIFSVAFSVSMWLIVLEIPAVAQTTIFSVDPTLAVKFPRTEFTHILQTTIITVHFPFD